MEQVIEKRIVIRAKAETAFRALTESRSLARWFANRAESKAVEGGSLLLMWGTGEQVEGARATFTRLVPGREVSLQWVSKIKPGETIAVTGQHTSTFRIDPSPEGVIVTMRYMADPAPADHERMKMDQDWDQAMVSLKALCEGPDAPVSVEGGGAGASGGAGGGASRGRAGGGMDADPIERVRVVATPKAKKAPKPKKSKAAAKPKPKVKAKPKKKAAPKKSAKPKKKAAAKAKKKSAKKPAKKPVKSAAKRAKAKPKAKPKSKAKPKLKAKSKKAPKKKAAAKSAKKTKSGSAKKTAKKSRKPAKKR